MDIGRICCRLSQRSNAIASLGRHLRDQTRVVSQRPLRVHVSIRDNQGIRAEVAAVELSNMVRSMVQNEPYSERLSFDLKHKAAPIEIRLQFGDAASSSCLISGFPRSLVPNSWSRERPISRLAGLDTNSSVGPLRDDRVLDWKPPERQDGMNAVDIQRYIDPSRKLGYNVDDPKRQDSRLRSHLLSRILPQSSENDASHLAKSRMNPIRAAHARQRALELGLDPTDLTDVNWSRFFLALSQGDKALAKLILMSVKANINLQDRRGRTLLHIAALIGDEDAVHLLQQHGARSTRDRHSWLPIDIARREGFPQLFHLLSLTSLSPNDRQPLPLSYYPEPTEWAGSTNPSAVTISDNGLVAFFADKDASGPAERLTGARRSVISNHPIPPDMYEYYFEVEILGACRDGR